MLVCHTVKFKTGAAGVDLFFVISGYIMATIAPGRTPVEFLKARLRRIYPIYWIASVPWLILVYRMGWLSAPKLLSSITLWPVFGQFYRPSLPAGWSLCFEMAFYLAVAASLAWGARWVLIAYAGMVVASFVYPMPLTQFLGNLITVEFLAGVLIARFQPKLSAWWLVPAFALLVLSPDLSKIVIEQRPDRLMWWGLPAVLIFSVALSNEGLFQHKAFDLPVFLGDASYSIYLWHQFILLGKLPVWLGMFACVSVGSISYLYLEKPIARMRTRQPRPLLAGGR